VSSVSFVSVSVSVSVSINRLCRLCCVCADALCVCLSAVSTMLRVSHVPSSSYDTLCLICTGYHMDTQIQTRDTQIQTRDLP